MNTGALHQHAQGHVARAFPAFLYSIRRRSLPSQAVTVTHTATHPSPSLVPVPDAYSVSGKGVQVRTIIDRNRTTALAVEINAAARAAAAALVDREHRRCLSRMIAYETVAAMVGASSSWLRKFVNGYPEAKPDLVVGFNILLMYARFTTRRDEGGT